MVDAVTVLQPPGLLSHIHPPLHTSRVNASPNGSLQPSLRRTHCSYMRLRSVLRSFSCPRPPMPGYYSSEIAMLPAWAELENAPFTLQKQRHLPISIHTASLRLESSLQLHCSDYQSPFLACLRTHKRSTPAASAARPSTRSLCHHQRSLLNCLFATAIPAAG